MTEVVHDVPQKEEVKFQFHIPRFYTVPGSNPLDEQEYEIRNAKIANPDGSVVFQMDGVEVPKSWTQLATDIAASKYFRKAGVPGRGHEYSARQLVYRVAHSIRKAGEELGGYFATREDADCFEAELSYLLINQNVAFNSPVWFNCGLFQEYGVEGSGGNYFWNPVTDAVEKSKNAYEHPQCSACFIQSVQDDLMSIYELVKNEARIFKYGSGTGTNFSKIRGRQEKLSGGGYSSGLMSFLEVFDRGAGATKSGGTTRRAAKMVCLDMDHPEIADFINWKLREEKKAHALVDAGWPADFNGEAYKTVGGQNSNNSVRIPDEFMRAYLNGGKWATRLRTSGEVLETYDAKDMMNQIAYAAWACADPGVQFDTTINDWHTVPNTDRINASNPCSEYMHLDDSACNLASINVMKFVKPDGQFDVDGYRQAIRIFVTAMDIIVDFASYPTEKIGKNSHDYRPLGLGYANVGTYLMVNGIPYDSEEGRAIVGAFSAILSGYGYRVSAEIAGQKAPFNGFSKNRQPMLRVMEKHRDAAYGIHSRFCPEYLLRAARQDWDECVAMGEKNGYRNSQISVIAPTGTIALLMDCDTTGIEPDFALVKFKKLAGGGYFKIVNHSVPKALQKLGYTESQIDEIIKYICGTATFQGTPHVNHQSLLAKGLTNEEIERIEGELPKIFELSFGFSKWALGEDLLKRLGLAAEQYNAPGFNFLKAVGFTEEQIAEASGVVCGRMTIEGAPHLKEEDLPVFDCANKCGSIGKRYIDAMGHVRMMAAAQPFISGAISKTVNLPNEATVDEIKQTYVESWKMGIKAMAVYRDGSKRSQPLNTTSKEDTKSESSKEGAAIPRPVRRKLPNERQSITHKFNIAGNEGYITVGMYEDGTPGEIFITMSKEGTFVSGLCDAFATAISLSLQYGVPLKALVDKFSHSRFEPSGWTENPDIRYAKSVMDYIFRWLGSKFVVVGKEVEGDSESSDNPGQEAGPVPAAPPSVTVDSSAVKVATNGFQVAVPVSQNGHGRKRHELNAIAQIDSPPCPECGSFMTASGTCFKCVNCGSTSGCS